MGKQQFTVTQDHINLLRRAWVDWDDGEFGAPAIDCKRPYGNSDVYTDILEILGQEAKGTFTIGGETFPLDDETIEFAIPDSVKTKLAKLHRETRIVLQIFLSTGIMRVGDYEAEDYSIKWHLVS